MSDKVWCAVCQTTHAQDWMPSELVLPSTQLTVLERLKGLELQLQAHCILCTACYYLVEQWDKHIAAAAKTEELLKGLIPTPENHLFESPESGDNKLIREHQEESDGTSDVFSDSFPLGPARVGTDGLTDAEVAVADCLVTAFGRPQSQVPDRNSTTSGTNEVHQTNHTTVADVNLADPNEFEGSETSPSLALAPGTDAGVLKGELPSPVVDRPVTRADPVGVNATNSVSDVATTDSCVSVKDVTVPVPLVHRNTDSARPGEAPRSESGRPACARAAPPPAAADRTVAGHHCHICGKAFARRDSLNVHLAAHAGSKAYACGECGLRFQYRDGLLVHRRRHHGNGRLTCPHCPVQFEKSCNLRRHLRVHTGERPFGCQFCPKRFAQSNGLKKHVRSLHAHCVVPKPS